MAKARIVSLEPKKDEKTGRMNMVPVEGTQKVVEAQLVLIAAGFLGSQPYVTDAFQVELDPIDIRIESPGHTRPACRECLPAGICTGASLWWCGPSRREERPRKRWTTT